MAQIQCPHSCYHTCDVRTVWFFLPTDCLFFYFNLRGTCTKRYTSVVTQHIDSGSDSGTSAGTSRWPVQYHIMTIDISSNCKQHLRLDQQGCALEAPGCHRWLNFLSGQLEKLFFSYRLKYCMGTQDIMYTCIMTIRLARKGNYKLYALKLQYHDSKTRKGML